MDNESQVNQTFCFVDIAGYTALTDTHGEYAAADLIQTFERLLEQAIEDTGTIHEFIGDCAFLVFPDVDSCCKALVRLFESINNRNYFPVVRAGIHHGSALKKGGRYFGSTINVAARVSAQAIGGQVLCTREVAEALAPPEAYSIEPLGEFKLRNIPEPLELFVLNMPGDSESAIDPVCKMQIDRRSAAGQLVYEDERYFFCSLECAKKFVSSPGSFVNESA